MSQEGPLARAQDARELRPGSPREGSVRVRRRSGERSERSRRRTTLSATFLGSQKSKSTSGVDFKWFTRNRPPRSICAGEHGENVGFEPTWVLTFFDGGLRRPQPLGALSASLPSREHSVGRARPRDARELRPDDPALRAKDLMRALATLAARRNDSGDPLRKEKGRGKLPRPFPKTKLVSYPRDLRERTRALRPTSPSPRRLSVAGSGTADTWVPTGFVV